MSSSNLFGKIVTGAMVERAMRDTLELWINDYLGEVERLEGYAPGSIQRPLGYVTTSEFDKWPEDQLPVYLVMCVGLAGEPVRRGDSSWESRWGVGVGVVASDVDGSLGSDLASRRLGQAHGAAIRAAIMQHKSLGGFAGATIWRDEKYGDLPFEDQRTLASTSVVFEVIVEGVVTESMGPAAPSADPTADPGPFPAVTTVTTTAQPRTITEAVRP